MWKHLVEVYALRAREFSDAVARLGKHTHPGPGTLGLMEEIKRLQTLCIAAGDEVGRYLEKKGGVASSS
jgi:hypothetical protein